MSKESRVSDRSESITIGFTTVEPGERRRLEIPVARLPTENWMSMAAEVVNGRRPGPGVGLSAAVHGDEINGVEIIRLVMQRVQPNSLRGCLIAVPIVNVFGFIAESRYLPDRRDLNRSFPGSRKGSLAARLAHLFMHEVVQQCTHGIDLHTGSHHRINLPQVRANLRDDETHRFAETFGAPIMIDAQTRDGSLRQAAAKLGKTVLLYEAGEALRFDEFSITSGVQGILRVMSHLKMIRGVKKKPHTKPVTVSESTWVRARRSGIARLNVALGSRVENKQVLASITDAFGDNSLTVRAPYDGIVIGCTTKPLVHQGDAILHLAKASGD